MSDTDFDWRSIFSRSESPYFAMFRAGCNGIALDDCVVLCMSMGIPIRHKDIQAWKDGNWRFNLRDKRSVLNPILCPSTENRVPILDMRLQEFDTWPMHWEGTSKRWFPCSDENIPLQKWGYSDDYSPTLYEREEAQALSPCGWVGQNMYAQPFIVMDIDGVGHGERDDQVIAFGNQYRDLTETWENPNKVGSFHLYFATPHIIPIAHFGFAKLDLMGNQKNAAVYTKDKQSNGVERLLITDEIWEFFKNYIRDRKAQQLERS